MQKKLMDARSEKEKMLAGDCYLATDAALTRERLRARRLCREFNATREDEAARREKILKDLFGSMGEGAAIEPSFRCDYGYNIHVGRGFYANFDLIVLDVCEVRIGDGCLVGPRVCIATAAHPVDSERRRSGVEYGRPITIGHQVWIGAGAIINPGVTLGDNVIVAAGAVVTKRFGSNVMVGGVPAREMRAVD